MEFSIKSGSPEKLRSACVVVGVFEQGGLSPAAETLNQAAQGYLADIVRGGDMDGKPGATLMLHRVPGLAAARVLLVGLGKESELGDKNFRDAVRGAIKALSERGIAEAGLCLAELPVKQRDPAWAAEQIVLVAADALYRFERMKSKPETSGKSIKKLALVVAARAGVASAEAGVARGQAIAAGVNLAKDLGNLPGNVCTPSYLADQARAMAKSRGLGVKVLGREQIEKLGMGSFLSVAKGSDEPPRFIVLEHKGGAKKQKPVVLVGKGITFDSGGISLKPGAEMDEMKYDMCGAASVLGALQAAADLKLPLNIVGLIPACENLPSGRANKPGDVVTSMSGQTIEVLNTDAEGRLILCDALTYAERFDPACVVDVATLTGACVIALGNFTSGLLANDDALAQELLAAGNEAQDRCWQLPLFDEYQDLLKSNFADMANIGGRAGGTISAACFLSRFTQNYAWAHLDIAGTAWKSGKDKGGTGRPVPLLVHFLAKRAAG
ncbi:MAG: leucyl aminopeptidase [Betaproteobacteria bacterium]|nr:leucyl aminopeptidase [Betaproteobacteria bacterium]